MTKERVIDVISAKCKVTMYWFKRQRETIITLIFIGQCIIVIVENKRPTWCHLLFLFNFLCAQYVSDINISIIRSLRLFCWTTTLVACSWFDVCWSFGVVGRLKQMSETCWAHKEWNKNNKWHQVGLLFSTIITHLWLFHFYLHIQGVPGGMCQTSGGCSLC